MSDNPKAAGPTSSDSAEPCELTKSTAPCVRFGVSGWDYKDWRGPLYPSKLPKAFRGLSFLSRFLDFMEVNVSFYRIPPAANSERWLSETKADFSFLPKLHQSWTHEFSALNSTEATRYEEFLEAFIREDRCEGILLQFPPSFMNTDKNRQWILSLRDRFATQVPCFVEVRNRSFYQHAFFELLETEGIAFTNVDFPDLAKLPPLSTINTSSIASLRLHGRNSVAWSSTKATRDEKYHYHYSAQQIQEIGNRSKEFLTRSRRLLIGGNNHFKAGAPAAVLQLQGLLHQDPGLKGIVPKPKAPQALMQSYPLLKDYCDELPEFERLGKVQSDSQPSLFESFGNQENATQ